VKRVKSERGAEAAAVVQAAAQSVENDNSKAGASVDDDSVFSEISEVAHWSDDEMMRSSRRVGVLEPEVSPLLPPSPIT